MKHINSTAWELILGILLCGVVLEVLILSFLCDADGAISLGLVIGLVTAILMVLHMNYSIDKLLDKEESEARKGAVSGYSVRMVGMIVVLLAVSVTKKVNFLSCVLGIFTLKVAVYLQPFTHRIIRRVRQ